jgi:hypothetical protein
VQSLFGDILNYQQNPRSNLQTLGLRIALGLAIVGILSGYWSFALSGTTSAWRWWGNWLQDVGTEMLGAAVTILLVELVIYQKRDEASRLDQVRQRRREHLTTQLKRACTLERRQKLLNRMSQQQLLTEAWLYELDLQKVELDGCDLSDADLSEANLCKASLKEASLKEAMLRRANLSQANLVAANLQNADLVEANLAGANLQTASLTGADLSQAQWSSQTRLPDGQHWSPGIDLQQFTHPLKYTTPPN